MGQAPFYAFAAAVVAFLILSLFQPKRAGTIQQYFWGDGKLSRRSVINLLLSNSFSLNGLLYQAWLGYLIGWWSIAIQLVWCASLIFLWLRPDRLAAIIHDGTLHGIIGERFGDRAARLAAIASTIGFAGLIGWEAVVGATVIRQFGGVSAGLYVVLPILLALVSAYYTRNGGLQGNGVMNQIQNAFKAVVLLVATVLLFLDSTNGFNSASANKNLAQSVAALGGMGLIANIAFSLLWQAVDMSVWQSLAGLNRQDETKAAAEIRSAIPLTALSILVFPGFVGSFIGMILAGTSSHPTDMTILNVFVGFTAHHFCIALLLVSSFGAAMLSTIDGYSLAASQAISWDIVRSHETRDLLAAGADRLPNNSDKLIISLSRAIVFFVGVGGSLAMIYLVFGLQVSLFNLVYAVVVSQMSLTGPVLFTLFGRKDFRARAGWLPIGASLSLGLVAVVLGVSSWPDLLTWAPVVTIFLSITVTAILYAESSTSGPEGAKSTSETV